MSAKGPDAFRTISEAAAEVGAPAHVLRFWESRFNFIKPMRRAGGRRFYRPADVRVLAAVRQLLHEQGYSIKTLQRLSPKAILEEAEKTNGHTLATETAEAPAGDLRAALERAMAAKARLDSLLAR